MVAVMAELPHLLLPHLRMRPAHDLLVDLVVDFLLEVKEEEDVEALKKRTKPLIRSCNRRVEKLTIDIPIVSCRHPGVNQVINQFA